LKRAALDFRGADGVEREHGSSRRSNSGSKAKRRARCHKRCCWPRKVRTRNWRWSFKFVPERRAPQAFSTASEIGNFQSRYPQAVGHVSKSRLGMIGTLEKTCRAAAMRGNVMSKKMSWPSRRNPLKPGAAHGFVHEVESEKQRGLSANPDGPNDRG